MTIALPPDYEIRELTGEEFLPLWRQHRDRIFQGVAFRLDPPRDAAKEKPGGEPWRLAYGLYHGTDFVGWTLGHGVDATRFEMYNSAVFEPHRGRGLYRALVLTVLDRVFAAGYGVVSSRHHPSNAAVLIAKLKCGFVISGMFVDPAFGTLVELSCFSTSLSRTAFDYRVGLAAMSDELSQSLRKPSR
jgi:GNAT superfamily N-acetyltransferase